MRATPLAIVVMMLLSVGCTLKTYTFQVVDADTHRPMKGVHIGHRDILTMPDDSAQILWFSEIWHPFPTGEDGRFTCTVDSNWWHVLHFCPPDCAGNSAGDHLDAFATISPAPVTVRIGDWPKEGKATNVDGVIVVKLETLAHRDAKRPPQTLTSTQPAAAAK